MQTVAKSSNSHPVRQTSTLNTKVNVQPWDELAHNWNTTTWKKESFVELDHVSIEQQSIDIVPTDTVKLRNISMATNTIPASANSGNNNR